MRLADGQPDPHEHPRRKQPRAGARFGVGKHAADRDAAGARVHLVVDEVDRGPMRVFRPPLLSTSPCSAICT